MQNCRWLNVFVVATSLLLTEGCGTYPRPQSPSERPVGADLNPRVISDELDTLAGAWSYERQVVGGRKIPIAELIPNLILVAGNRMTREVHDSFGERLTPVQSTIHVDPTTTPKQIDDDLIIEPRIYRQVGIYKLEGDRLTLCYDNTGTQRPNSFDSPPGSSFVLTVLRRHGK